MTKAEMIILCGDGINCERETALALLEAGGNPKIIHMNRLIENPNILLNSQGLILPGGFSFGDDLGSGRVLATKLLKLMTDHLHEFLLKKRPIMGICNGFQALVKMNYLPFPESSTQWVTLTENRQGHFINKWAPLKINKKSPCLWTQLVPERISLPIRHGEGRLLINSHFIKEFEAQNQTHQLVALSYEQDENGSHTKIAGLTDPTGLILGLMPHPEAATFPQTSPAYAQDPHGPGFYFFKSILKHLKEN